MIPKTIYYCWFGRKPLPKSVKKCIASWKKYCPNYTITEINEDNFDVHSNPYTSHFYHKKRYAFVSDYARLKVIYDNGGIYMDTDVELLKSLDPLLQYRCYFGFEFKGAVNSGQGFGAERNLPLLKDMMTAYDAMAPINNKCEAVICTKINTDAFVERYQLKLDGKTQFFEDKTIAVFSPEYFNPPRLDKIPQPTENTYSIHWYDASWITPGMRIRLKAGNLFRKVTGEHPSVWLKKHIPFLKK